MPAPEGGHQSSSRYSWYSPPTRSRLCSASGIAALTVTPVFLPSVFIGMPAAQPTICRPSPEIGEHGEPFMPVSRRTGAVARAIPEPLVVAEIHLVLGVLVIGPRLQGSPAEAAGVGQIELVAAVVRHVHALVGIGLVRDVLDSRR